MAKSIFTYSLSRAYPVRWFTPVVIVGGIILTIAVSFLSVATSGYQLNAISSSDPNATESGRTWYGRRLGLVIGSMQPSCAPTTIPLGTVLYTNNTALAYTLQAISLSANGTTTPQGSLVYQHNLLEDCSVTRIEVLFESIERPPNAFATSQQGADLKGYVTCGVSTPRGIASINLTTTWSYIDSGSTEPSFIVADPKTQSSLYWAKSLLVMYWIALTSTMYASNNAYGDKAFYKGAMYVTRNSVDASNTLAPPIDAAGVMSLDFFNTGCWFLPFSTTGYLSSVSYCGNNPPLLSSYVPPHADDYYISPMPSIWPLLDTISKALYYTILTDLGQDDIKPNLLTDPSLLQYFTANLSNINAVNDEHHWGESVAVEAGVSVDPFTSSSASEYDLGVRSSTLATNYLCQVPRLKPTGPLVVSVLVADLVLLQAIWKVFKLIVDPILLRRHPSMGCCEGCMQNQGGSGHELLQVPKGPAHRGRYISVDRGATADL